ncbi:MAG: hypothetical protein H8E19_00295 [Deltaproteobacteria bacterium]|uniref:Uncharacterized protein n=1 Tax=Candidatus Desulfacyla euxinica TaxID=2841693 RepID=A0A8J6MV57_9DELT|nr:hypothetical protein [Candidatus Desulfacyla euxinica]
MIRPVREIGDNRILTPNQADFLPLLVNIKPQEVRSFFERSIREMVREEISGRD